MAKRKGPHSSKAQLRRGLAEHICKHGLTPEDLRKAEAMAKERGYREAMANAMPCTYKLIIASICLVAKRRRWTRARIIDFIRDVMAEAFEHLCYEDAYEEVLREVGLELRFHDMEPLHDLREEAEADAQS